MSFIVKGIGTPSCCDECPFLTHDEEEVFMYFCEALCEALPCNFIDDVDTFKLPNCPIEEVKE